MSCGFLFFSCWVLVGLFCSGLIRPVLMDSHGWTCVLDCENLAWIIEQENHRAEKVYPTQRLPGPMASRRNKKGSQNRAADAAQFTLGGPGQNRCEKLNGGLKAPRSFTPWELSDLEDGRVGVQLEGNVAESHEWKFYATCGNARICNLSVAGWSISNN